MVYSQVGSGQTIVLLHGFLEERGMWNSFLPELSKKFNVVTIDLLGQGESGCLGYLHSMQAHAEAVLRVIDEEKIDAFKLIGHSMGGYVALALGRIVPDRISGVMLFHSTAEADSEERKRDRERIIKLVKRNKSIYVKTVIPGLFAEETKAGLEKEVNSVIATALGFEEQGIAANIRGMMERPDSQDVLRDARFKKLILHGELDPIITTKSVEKQAKLNQNITLKVVDSISHMGHLEAPAICVEAISEFCEN